TGTIHSTHNGGANSNIFYLTGRGRDAGALRDWRSAACSSPPPPPGGGISLRATAIGNNGSGSSTLTIGLPAGTTSGDVMLAHVRSEERRVGKECPTGWSLALRKERESTSSTTRYAKLSGARDA